MEPYREERAAFRVVGISSRTNNEAEANPATSKIGGQWQTFFQNGIAGQITSQTEPGTIYGVYTEYATDHNGEYTHLLGCAVNQEAETPAGMTSWEVPASNYLVFTGEAATPEATVATWQAIWQYFEDNKQVKRAYTTDFEIHQPGYTIRIFITLD